jgi:hypothetical protein
MQFVMVPKLNKHASYDTTQSQQFCIMRHSRNSTDVRLVTLSKLNKHASYTRPKVNKSANFDATQNQQTCNSDGSETQQTYDFATQTQQTSILRRHPYSTNMHLTTRPKVNKRANFDATQYQVTCNI